MGMSFTPSNKDTEYAEIRGNLSENACTLFWDAAKFYRVDDTTLVMAGRLKADTGLDYYPRDKRPNYPELAFIKLRKGTFEVNTKNSRGDWEKVKREPIRVERCFVEEIFNNWDDWKDSYWEGHINLNDLLLPAVETPIGKNNQCWSLSKTLYANVIEWQVPAQKENGFTKFAPKKSAMELYDETIAILEKEISSENTLGNALSKLRERYGETGSSEIVNTVIYGILAK